MRAARRYHDEPKASSAHVWLPLTLAHYARKPPLMGEELQAAPSPSSRRSTCARRRAPAAAPAPASSGEPARPAASSSSSSLSAPPLAPRAGPPGGEAGATASPDSRPPPPFARASSPPQPAPDVRRGAAPRCASGSSWVGARTDAEAGALHAAVAPAAAAAPPSWLATSEPGLAAQPSGGARLPGAPALGCKRSWEAAAGEAALWPSCSEPLLEWSDPDLQLLASSGWAAPAWQPAWQPEPPASAGLSPLALEAAARDHNGDEDDDEDLLPRLAAFLHPQEPWEL
jgi:hypothetical protein